MTAARYPEYAQAAPGVWESTLDLDAEPWLRDHSFHSWPLLPAAAYIDAPLTAAGGQLGDGAPVLEHVGFENTLFLGEVEPTRLRVSLADREFAVEALDEDGWQRYSSGRLTVEPLAGDGERVELGDVHAEWGEGVPGSFHYDQTLAQGALYGPAFRGVQRLWRRPGESLAHTVLHESLRAGSGRFAFHPAFLDACLQATVMCFPDELIGGSVYLPTGIDRFRLRRPPTHSIWCLARASGESEDGRTLTGEAVLFADDGAVVAEMHGLRGQRTQRKKRRHARATEESAR